MTHAIVRVTVEDENDHTPTFGNTHLSLEVPEGQDPQTLTTLRASDPDRGLNGKLQYRILGERYPGPQGQHLLAWFLLFLGSCHFMTMFLCLFPLLLFISLQPIGIFKLPLLASPVLYPSLCLLSLSYSFYLSLHRVSCFQTFLVSGTLKTLFYVIGSQLCYQAGLELMIVQFQAPEWWVLYY